MSKSFLDRTIQKGIRSTMPYYFLSKFGKACIDNFEKMCSDKKERKEVVFEQAFSPLLLSCLGFRIIKVTRRKKDFGTDIVASINLKDFKILKNSFNSFFGNLYCPNNVKDIYFLVQAKCHKKAPVKDTKLREFIGGALVYEEEYGRPINHYMAITTSKFSKSKLKYPKSKLVFIDKEGIFGLIKRNIWPFYFFFILYRYHEKKKISWKSVIETCSIRDDNTMFCPKCRHYIKVDKLKQHIKKHEYTKACPICKKDIEYYEFPKHLKKCFKKYKKKERKKLRSNDEIECPCCHEKFKMDELNKLNEHFYYKHSYGSIKRDGSINESYYLT